MSTHALDVIKLRRTDPYADAVKVTEGNVDAIIIWLEQNGQYASRTKVAGYELRFTNDLDRSYAAQIGDWVVYDEDGYFMVIEDICLFDNYEVL